jgi:hypothetical protein
MSGSPVTDAGLREIGGITNLTALSLNNTKVTNSGMKALTQLKHLNRLCVTGTKVSDAGLLVLTDCKELISMDQNSPLMTEKGVNQFLKALPNCIMNGRVSDK